MRKTWDPTFPTVALAIAMLVGTVAATSGIGRGDWRGQLDHGESFVQLELCPAEGHSFSRVSLPVETRDLEGFDVEAFARRGAPLQFAWKHDAGTFHFEGKGGRRARGRLRFEPNPEFGARWQALGFGEPARDELVWLALDDIRIADVERLHELGYRGVEAGLIRQIRSLTGSMDWIEEFARSGYTGDLDDILRFYTHGLSGEELRAFQEAGLEGLDADDLLRLHSHGIPARYVAALRSAGLGEVSVDDAIRLYSQGVSSDLAQALVAVLPRVRDVDPVIRLHAHGVDADWARGMAEVGYGDFSADDLIRVHEHGVGPELARSLARAGLDDLSADDLIRASTLGADTFRKREIH